jgi:hypothetical protein
MTDRTYNGWTNYATWRVNLEIFDGMDFRDVFGNNERKAGPIAMECRNYAEELVFQAGGGEGNIAVDYALAFLQDVNWYEIAEHLLEDEETPDEIEE